LDISANCLRIKTFLRTPAPDLHYALLKTHRARRISAYARCIYHLMRLLLHRGLAIAFTDARIICANTVLLTNLA